MMLTLTNTQPEAFDLHKISYPNTYYRGDANICGVIQQPVLIIMLIFHRCLVYFLSRDSISWVSGIFQLSDQEGLR